MATASASSGATSVGAKVSIQFDAGDSRCRRRMATAENRRIVVASHPGYIVGHGSDRRLTQREPGGLCRVFLSSRVSRYWWPIPRTGRVYWSASSVIFRPALGMSVAVCWAHILLVLLFMPDDFGGCQRPAEVRSRFSPLNGFSQVASPQNS